MTMAESPSRFIVRVVGPGGTTAGVGTLVGHAEITTCAHVVNTALGLDPRSSDRPTGSITVEFSLLAGQPLGTARLRQWLPPPQRGEVGNDVAGLELIRPMLPAGAGPARLAIAQPSPGRQVRVFGYPGTPPRPFGAWVTSTIQGQVGGGLLQVDSGVDAALRVQPGYSGSPMIDVRSGLVVGMVAQAAPGRALERDSYAINTDRMRLAWSDGLTSGAVGVGVPDAWSDGLTYRAVGVDITDATLQSEVFERSNTAPVVVNFWADWCSPCRTFSPVLEKLAYLGQGTWVLARVDTDANLRVAQSFNVQSIPMTCAVVRGRVTNSFLGVMPEYQLQQWLETVLEE
jgi:thioredoxin